MGTTFRRKQNRLPLGVYRGAAAYFLTLRCPGNTAPFSDSDLVSSCLDVLQSCSVKHHVSVHAYCFMPDHLHLLIEGTEGAFVPDFVKEFKQLTGYAYRRRHSRSLWQKSYYDHVLRKEEAIWDVARYVVANPVRRGLVSQPSHYPHSGSFVWGGAVMEA